MSEINEERIEAWSFGWKDHSQYLPETEDLDNAKHRLARYSNNNTEASPSEALRKEIAISQWCPENTMFRSLKSMGAGPQHLLFISEELLDHQDYLIMDREEDMDKGLTRLAVFSMGRNKGAQLGQPTKDPLSTPARIEGLWHLQLDALSLACGPIHNAAIISDPSDPLHHKLYVWGQVFVVSLLSCRP